ADQGAHAPYYETEEYALRSVHARQQRGEHGLGLALAVRELHVGSERILVESNVVRNGSENMGRVLGPAWDADVDLADRAETVAREKRGEPVLEPPGERRRPVRGSEVRGRPLEKRGARVRVGAHVDAERPQRQVHFCGRVVRCAASNCLELVV